ncbi:hypothetical protein BDV3_003227 [Batrachochytrium dendrobatidis]
MKEQPSVLLSLARIKILVVPVHPIRQDTFNTYLHLLSQFGSVSLKDLTPPDAKTAKFTNQFYHDGCIHFNFATSHNKEHSPLEEIQLSRQVLGVIGIMNCQQTPNLLDGYKRFQHIVQRYTTTLAYRCFGFEPLDTQADNIKGLVMIPNVGNISFYLQTMIADFTADLLLAFGSLAGQIERRSLINGPVMISPLFQYNTSNSSTAGSQYSGSLGPAGSPVVGNTILAATAASVTIHAPPSAHTIHANTPIDRMREMGTGILLTQDTPVSATFHTTSPISNNLGSASSIPTGTGSPHPLHSASLHTQPSLSSMGSSAMNLGFGLSTLLNPDKSRKRTPARIQKLLGDLYLIAGRLDMAIASFFAAIESTKNSGDLQWQAAAMESLCCAQLLSLSDKIGLCNSTRNTIVSYQDSKVDTDSMVSGGVASTATTPNMDTSLNAAQNCSASVLTSCLPTTIDLISASKISKQLSAFLSDLPERFREMVYLYDRSIAFGAPGFYPIMQVLASIKMATFLAYVCMDKYMISFGVNGAHIAYWSSETRGIGAEIAARIGSSGSGGSSGPGVIHGNSSSIAGTSNIATNMGGIIANAVPGGVLGNMIPSLASTPTTGGSQTVSAINTVSSLAGQPTGLMPMLNPDRILLQNGLGASKADVISWTMRAWHSGMEYLTVGDQISSVASLSAICSIIESHRKHAFFLHHMALLSNAIMTGKFASGRYDGSYVPTKETLFSSASTRELACPPLNCLERVFDLLSMQDNDFHDGANKQKSLFSSIQSTYVYDVWLEEYENQEDLDQASSLFRSPISRGITIPSIQNGWPSLQIGVLKQCIYIAQSREDDVRVVRYICKLLRMLYRHISKRDQAYFSEVLQQVALHHRNSQTLTCSQGEEGADGPCKDSQYSLQPLVRGIQECILGVPVLRRLVPIKPLARQVPNVRLRKDMFPDDQDAASSTTTAPKNVFIYNPYAEKASGLNDSGMNQGANLILVAMETVQVDVTLANPFLFDIDVQQIALFTSGVPFDPVMISTRIAADTRTHTIRLSGTPLQDGILYIHGIKAKIFGGCIEEVVYPVRCSLDNPKMCTINGKKLKQDDRARAGKKRLEFLYGGNDTVPITKSASASDISAKKWSMPLKVICAQPMLEVFSTSLGGHYARMLFEGERSTFKTIVKNIGSIPITYIQVNISEQTDTVDNTMESLPGFLDAYEQDIHNKSLRSCWFESYTIIETADQVNVGDSVKDSKAAGLYSQTARALKPSESIYGVLGHFTTDTRMLSQRLDIDLKPGQFLELVFGIYGKRNCTGVNVQFEYAHVDLTPSSQSTTTVPDVHFYTRLVVMPVLLTVRPVITVHNVDFLLHSHNELSAAQVLVGSPVDPVAVPNELEDQAHSRAASVGDMMTEPRLADAVMDAMQDDDQVRMLFVMTFDVHNKWNEPFHLNFDLYEDDETNVPTSTYDAVIHSGASKRIILPLKRITLPQSEVEKSIPTPAWKQYILNKTAMQSPEGEALSRAIYWYRESLVGGLSHRGRILTHWTCSRSRQGILSLRDFTPTQRMLHIVKSESISLIPTVTLCTNALNSDQTDSADTHSTLVRLQPGSFQCQIKTLIRLEWQITNHKNTPVDFFIRIVPILNHDILLGRGVRTSHDHSLDLLDTLFVSGQLQSSMTRLDPGCTTTHGISIWMRSLAKVKFVCHVEEIERPVKASTAHPVVHKKSKYDVPPIVLGNFEKIHWDHDGVVIEGTLQEPSLLMH